MAVLQPWLVIGDSSSGNNSCMPATTAQQQTHLLGREDALCDITCYRLVVAGCHVVCVPHIQHISLSWRRAKGVVQQQLPQQQQSDGLLAA